MSTLVSFGGCEWLVKSHVAANIYVDNDRARLIDALAQLLFFTGYSLLAQRWWKPADSLVTRGSIGQTL